MAKGYLLGQVVISTKAVIVKMSETGMARCTGPMVAAIKVNGRVEFSTASVSLFCQMEYGKKDILRIMC